MNKIKVSYGNFSFFQVPTFLGTWHKELSSVWFTIQRKWFLANDRRRGVQRLYFPKVTIRGGVFIWGNSKWMRRWVMCCSVRRNSSFSNYCNSPKAICSIPIYLPSCWPSNQPPFAQRHIIMENTVNHQRGTQNARVPHWKWKVRGDTNWFYHSNLIIISGNK